MIAIKSRIKIGITVKIRLRGRHLRLCYFRELATNYFTRYCGAGRRLVVVGTVSSAQIQFPARHPLRLLDAGRVRGAEKFDRFSRAQG